MAKYKNEAFEFSTRKIHIYKYTLEPREKREEIESAKDPPMQLINGKYPGSVEEWRVAVALWRLKIPFAYQVKIPAMIL